MKRKAVTIFSVFILSSHLFIHSTASIYAETLNANEEEVVENEFIEETLEEVVVEEEPPIEEVNEVSVEVEKPESLESEVTEEVLLEEADVIESESVEEVEIPEPEVETEDVVLDEYPDIPEYNREDTYKLAMEMMEQDLQQKKASEMTGFYSVRSISTGISHVDAYLNKIIPMALEQSLTSDVLPSIIIAQGALESAWGRSGLTLNANNLFGVKAHRDWSGPVYTVKTSEFVPPVKDKNGKVITEGYWIYIIDDFRKYPSWLESLKDHSKFLESNSRYEVALAATNYKEQAQALSAAGYATDPDYAAKLISIIETYDLYKYDSVPEVNARFHMQKIGWLQKTGNLIQLGNPLDNLRVEDLQFMVPDYNDVGIRFDAHIQDVGWSGWVYDGSNAGNTGKARHLEAIKLELTGKFASNFDVFYRVYSDAIGWSGWTKNGSAAGSQGFGKKIQSIQVRIAWKGDNPVKVSKAFYDIKNMYIQYRSHIEYSGWLPTVNNGALSGSQGLGRRMEAFRIFMTDFPFEGGITYQSHVQSHGWMAPISDGATSGTEGERKRVEAIKVNLTGKMAEEFDVYYRTHIQTFGWTGWAKNGAPSGSEGHSKRMEAFEVRLVKKGFSAPGSTSNTFFK